MMKVEIPMIVPMMLRSVPMIACMVKTENDPVDLFSEDETIEACDV